MPLDLGADYVDGQTATADIFNDKFNAIEAYINDPAFITDASIASDAEIEGSKLDTRDGRLRMSTGILASSSALNLGTSYADVPGATASFTPDVPCFVMVMTSFQFDWNKTDLSDTPTHVQEGVLTVDGTAQSYSAIARYIGSGEAGEDRQFTNTVSEVYRVSLTAAAHTIKLQAKHTTVGLTAESSQCAKAHALYFLVAQT